MSYVSVVPWLKLVLIYDPNDKMYRLATLSETGLSSFYKYVQCNDCKVTANDDFNN